MQFAINFFYLSFCLVVIYDLIKRLRAKRGALYGRVCMQDIFILFSVAGFFTAINEIGISFISYFAASLICSWGTLCWLDAILFVQYRIEINRQTIVWFFRGHKGIAKGLPYFLSLLLRYPWSLAILPILYYVVLATAEGELEPYQLFVIAIFYVVSFHDGRFRVSISAALSFFILFILLSVEGIFRVFNKAYGFDIFLSIAICITFLVCNLIHLAFKPATGFFNAPSLLPNILLDEHFKVIDKNINNSNPQSKSIGKSSQTKSEYFGICRDANIILITMESLGAYFPPYSNQLLPMRLMNRFEKNSWVSKEHYSLCPNTTVATNQIYTGDYSNNPYNKDDSLFFGSEPMHIRELKKHGYKTFFLDSADIGLYNYHKLLSQIGFDRVWGTKDLPSEGLQADYRLWNMLDVLVEENQGSPFFIHLINDQTHMPYQVVNSERFNRYKGDSQKAAYFNAVDEVDYIFDEFLKRLSKKIDLGNTLIVFTGDHGESFGEFGYSFHSNSVIFQQTKVPFALHHRNLTNKSIDHSCHFDLFPTFFDLLGIDYEHQCLGKPMGITNREKNYFFHSATLKGNTPANFSLLLENDIFWVDRLFGKSRHLKIENGRYESMDTDTKTIHEMLGKVLIDKKLVSRVR